jgi:hypothetical protein
MTLVAAALMAGCWSSDKSTTLGISAAPQPGLVGSAVCISCHTTTLPTDPSGQPIVARWQTTTHTTVQGVECEGCHGGGQDHWGLGPIPFPIPGGARCQVCHGKSGFDNTAHANLHLAGGPFGPDKFFFQGNAGTGQAANRGVPEFLPDNVTPITKAQHIEECSVCHNPNQPFVYNAGGVLGKPDPNNMPNPAPSCAGCHDAHHTQELTTIPQRAGKVGIQVFRPYFLNPAGAQVPLSDNTGSYVRGALFQPNGAVTATGAVNLANVVGKNNELNFEQTCAACHTAGKYKYAQTTTHQSDVYTQWLLSSHADRNAPAFGEFAANPAAYGPGFPAGAGTHQSLYPYDIGLGSTTGGAGSVGATADNTRNAAVSDGRGGFNDNYPCYKCHSGVGATSYLSDSQGTSRAELIFGDEPVMCYTCHSPHSQPTGTEFNLRVPRVMSKYSSTPSVKVGATTTTVTTPIVFSGNVFFDNTPVPGVAVSGNATVCIFCHQGRESGFTLYLSRVRYFGDPAFDCVAVKNSFFNPHYLGTGAMLWAKNGYEFVGAGFDNAYGFNSAHQGANCTTCHMDNATAPAGNGGHTWIPNAASCNAAGCHGAAGVAPAVAVDNTAPGVSPQVDSYRAAFDTSNYTGDTGGAALSIAESIRVLEQKLILLLASQATPIYYDDTAYPYFFATQDPATHTSANAFKAWTPATLKAAFNLSFVVKGLPSAGAGTSTVWLVGVTAPASVNDVGLPNTSSVLTPNASAAVHNYKYTIQLLQDSYRAVAGTAIPNAVRPATNRPATVYGANQ